MPDEPKNASLSQSNPVIEQNSAIKKPQKISFYLSGEQVDKLEDLAYEHRKRTGQRIKRTDIVRYLIDHCTIEALKEI